MDTVLELSNDNARQYFLNQESYCSIDFPKYFTFQSLLNDVWNKEIGIENFPDMCKDNLMRSDKKLCPKDYDGVNYTLFNNKDGKYAWRPLELINPAIYVFLVKKMTKKENWELIVKRFENFQSNPKIKCCSIPLVDENEITPPQKRDTILNWWENIEQLSLEYALEYDCFLNTDITDCYGSLYTHTIPWALYGKNAAKADRAPYKIGNCIDITIQGMSYGQTNGIPQGSVLMDFIAEIVLGYADMLLSEKITEERIDNYQILRYRDDYRIFSNNQEDINKIVKYLTEILIELNFRLNSQKTFLSNNVITDSIKPDKLYWIGTKKDETTLTLEKTLLLIHSLSEKFPNSGSLSTALSDFQKKVYNSTEIESENVKAIISIVVDIAYKNPRTYNIATAILSKLLSILDEDEVIDLVSKIEKKFHKIPNVGFLQVWLQRLTLKINEDKEYEEKLCEKVRDNNVQLWNNDWLNNDIKRIIDKTKIIDNEYIDNMEQIIKPEEVQLFEY